MTHDEAVSKAVRLLRLSKSDNAYEAASAAAKAQEIIDRYKLESLSLSTGSLEPDEPVADFSQAPLDEGEKVAEWKIRLASTVAKANQCRVYLACRRDGFRDLRGISIVGRASDSETVRYMFAWLSKEVHRLADRDGKGLGKSWRNNFRLGVVDTIGRKLAEQHQATEAAVVEEARVQTAIPSERSMVLVKQAIVKLEERAAETEAWVKRNLKLKNAPIGGGRFDPSARQSGRKAGEELNLRPAKGSLESGPGTLRAGTKGLGSGS